MSITKVTLTYKAEKTVNGSLVAVSFPLAGGGSTSLLTGAGVNKTAATQAIQSQLDAAQAVANGAAAEVQEANTLFNS